MSPSLSHRGLVSPTVQTFRAFEEVFNNFRYYTEMSCFLVTKDPPHQWLSLQPSPKSFGIVDFENRFGQDRDRYNRMNFRKLLTGRRPIGSRFSGFYDLFVPVLSRGKCIAFVTSGFFLKDLPTRQALEGQWKTWTGRSPAPGDTEFRRFVVNALNMPLLDGPQAKAHRELLEMVASLVSGEGDPNRIVSRAADLNHKVFTKWRLNAEWPRKALGLELVGSDQPWSDKGFGENDRIVTKMKRVPTVALALLLVDEQDRGTDDVDAMIRQKHLERSGFFLAQRLGETVSFPLGDEGLVFLTSPKPGANPTQAVLQLKEKARTISERIGKQFRAQALVGIGSILPSGEGLDPSLQEARLALQWAIHQDKKQVFYGDLASAESDPKTKGTSWPDALGLANAHLRGSKAEKASALNRYIREVIHRTTGRADLTRVHLINALSLHGIQLEKGLSLPPGRLSGLLQDRVSHLEDARTTHDLIASFKEALGMLLKFSADPSTAELAATVKDLKGYVAEHFRTSLTVDQAARRMGISRSSLHRYTRRWMGLGFNEYVQQVRLEEAKRMLRNSRFSIARIAQECGFSSSAYFIRTFKRNTRKTPLRFRNDPT